MRAPSASSVHRGDFDHVRRAVTVAVLELETLEPRIQIAYKRGKVPAEVVADVSLARLMATELDRLLRHALDVAIGDTGKYREVYAVATYDRRALVS